MSGYFSPSAISKPLRHSGGMVLCVGLQGDMEISCSFMFLKASAYLLQHLQSSSGQPSLAHTATQSRQGRVCGSAPSPFPSVFNDL